MTLVTVGLADLARDRRFAGEGGFAQELLMVVAAEFHTEPFLDLFGKSMILYARDRHLLHWFEPIRLSSPLPGQSRMRHLLPIPPAIFDETFPLLQHDDGSTTAFCWLLPMHESEIASVQRMSVSDFDESMAELDPPYWDLRREPLDLDHHGSSD